MTDAFPGPPGDDQAVPSPYPAAAAEPTPASDRKGLKIALILAMLAVVALGAMSIYLWTVHSEYVAQNEKLRETAAWLDAELQRQPWMAGERFTIADITAFCAIEFAKLMRFNAGEQGFSALQAWRDRVAQRPAARA